MIKLMLLLVFGTGSGLMLLAQKRRNARAVSHSKDLARISSLENFDFDSLKDVLDTLIRRKIFAGEINTGVLDTGFIKTNAPVPILEKFTIKSVNKSAGNEFLVIADARSNDILPTGVAINWWINFILLPYCWWLTMKKMKLFPTPFSPRIKNMNIY